MEDRPYTIKATGSGIRLDFAPCYGVKYRVASTSVERRNTKILSKYHLDYFRFQRDVVIKEVGFTERLLIRLWLMFTFNIYKTNRNVLTDNAKKQLHLIEKINRYVERVLSYKYYKYLGGMKRQNF